MTVALASAVLATPAAAVGQPPPAPTPPRYVACPGAKPPVALPGRPFPSPADAAVGGPALATAGLTAPPDTPPPPTVSAASWLVADLGSGAVLGGCGPHEYRTPASVQKLLLAATMMPRLDPARIVEVTSSDMDFEPGSSAVGLVAGGQYPVAILWLGLLLNSGNDTANVLARLGGGAAGMQGGVEAMNAEARRLGAYQTHAATPSGLDGPGQFTSAYDLALIARVCYAREDFRRYTATRTADIPAQPGYRGFQISNDNRLLDRYPGMLGGKTGFTDLARQTYVGVAERNGRRLVVTLLSAVGGSLTEASALLDWGFDLPTDAAVGRLVTPEELSSTPSVAAAVAAAAPGPRATGRAGTVWSVAVTSAALATAAILVLLFIRAAGRLATAAPEPGKGDAPPRPTDPATPASDGSPHV